MREGQEQFDSGGTNQFGAFVRDLFDQRELRITVDDRHQRLLVVLADHEVADAGTLLDDCGAFLDADTLFYLPTPICAAVALAVFPALVPQMGSVPPSARSV